MRTLVASSSFVAVFFAAAPAALAQAAPVCLKSTSGMTNCAYQSMAQCEAAKGINVAAQCIPRTQAGSGLTPSGTTGQGSPSPRPSTSR